MADFDSSLPVRTQTAGDVIAKLADATTPSQQLAIAADGSIKITDNGGSLTVDGTVELGATTLAALETINVTDGGGSITVDGAVTVSSTDLDIRDLAFATDKVDVSGSSVTVSATNLDVRDLSHTQDSIKIGDGTDFVAVNADGSINVLATISNDVAGTEVCSYNTTNDLAANTSVNYDYTVTAATTLIIDSAYCSSSGKIKVELKVETAPASGTYTTKFVGYNSSSSPEVRIPVNRYLKQVAGAKVRLTVKNRENNANDVHATLVGSES